MDLMATREGFVARCETFHARKDGPKNWFRYKVGYLMVPMLHTSRNRMRLFSRNRGNLFSLHDGDHGFGEGNPTDWVLAQASRFGLDADLIGQVWLLTQPRTFGYVFNPVSFWFLIARSGALLGVLSEVNNTFGERHSYICLGKDGEPITGSDRMRASKVFHVSPFQDVIGTYTFRFQFRENRFGVWINYTRPDEGGLFTSLTGTCVPLTDTALLSMIMRKPFGALRVMYLIHWQALKLTIKRAGFRSAPRMPDEDVTQ